MDSGLERLHNASMANVLVRDVPDDVHARLRARAAQAGYSLQQFLQIELKRLATQPSIGEWLDQVAGDAPLDISAEELAAHVQAGRDDRR